MWLAMEYLGLHETDAFEAASVDGGNDKDLEIFFVDEETERIVVGRTKFNENGRYRAKKNELLGSGSSANTAIGAVSISHIYVVASVAR